MISSQPLDAAVNLTTTLTASVNTHKQLGLYKHTVLMDWTPGTASNVFTIVIDFRVTGGQWVQEMVWDESQTTGTYTRTLKQYQHTAANTTLISFVVLVDGHGDEVRIRTSESEAGSSTKGTISATIYSSD